ALLNFQQMVEDLTGMEIDNASLLDEATAAAEAMCMSKRVSKSKSNTFFVDADCHPQTLAVIQTRAEPFGYDIVVGDAWEDLAQHDVFGVLIQYPGSSGRVRNPQPVIDKAHESNALVTMATDLLGLVLLKSPGEMDADIVVGNAQRFGVSLGFGGPHAAFFATRQSFIRNVPGRIIGVSKDVHDQQALRMLLQTREQHIRRDKATSNICTAQALLAILSGFYAIYHGPEGLKNIATRVHRYTQILVAWLKQQGLEIEHQSFFDTITVRAPGKARRYIAKARDLGINLRPIDRDTLGISFDEASTRRTLRRLEQVFQTPESEPLNIAAIDKDLVECIPDTLLRSSEFLTHPVFNIYHSETEMMRYMRRLARKDIALDRAIIPLGSCTMKLNASVELLALSYREFNAMHPFAPADQAQGYMQLLEELEAMLCDLTGFDAISFQPNSGAQGEYTGLLVIRKYHQVNGDPQRNICLIPSSAHGTNPASAVMAGMKVVVVKCDDKGNVDVADLTAKAEQYSNELAALMITYPSTHGVYEEAFTRICDIIHQHGGQVYMDGANFNALVGICRPAQFGADVSHLNLHKTFAIPHGGGGPGVGPIGVRRHLAPFLPDHPVVDDVNPDAGAAGTVGTVAAAPWGSASILSISWAYIAMMRDKGLRRATLIAILNANYIATKLRPYYPIL
ncbi:MAG: aminomethyl-transferring glycine dehydrogenase, partial [Gammaproteobacteria bacterium]